MNNESYPPENPGEPRPENHRHHSGERDSETLSSGRRDPVLPPRQLRPVDRKPMTFGRTFVASLLGSVTAYLVVIGIVTLLLFVMIAGIVSSADEAPSVPDESLLEVKLSGPIPEFVNGGSFALFTHEFNTRTLRDYIAALDRAADDDRIRGLLLRLEGYSGSPAQIEELVRAIRRFQQSRKFVYAISDVDGYAEAEYIVASTADSVFLPHSGYVELNGYYFVLEFYKPLLDKLNVQPIVVRAGSYKTAVEPFINERASPENEESVKAILADQARVATAIVAENRGLAESAVDTIINRYPLMLPEAALEQRLVDRLVYDDELEATLKAKLGVEDSTEDVPTVTLKEYISATVDRGDDDDDGADDRIAIVYAVGGIEPGESGYDPNPFFGGERLGSTTFVKAMREAREDEDVKAIVVRINSPGGGVSPSIAMWREVELATAEKPVIVSMAGVAASGGYYIAAPATEIVAEATTVTGSIGVFALFFNVDGLFEKTIGINTQVIKSGEHADIFSGMRAPTEDEMAYATANTDSVYRQFLRVVARGRSLSEAAADSIAQGRVWTGMQAKRLGLVDHLGGFDKALERAATLAKIDDYEIDVYPRPKDEFTLLFEALGNMESYLASKNLELSALDAVERLKSYSGMQARMVGLRVE